MWKSACRRFQSLTSSSSSLLSREPGTLLPILTQTAIGATKALLVLVISTRLHTPNRTSPPAHENRPCRFSWAGWFSFVTKVTIVTFVINLNFIKDEALRPAEGPECVLGKEQENYSIRGWMISRGQPCSLLGLGMMFPRLPLWTETNSPETAATLMVVSPTNSVGAPSAPSLILNRSPHFIFLVTTSIVLYSFCTELIPQLDVSSKKSVDSTSYKKELKKTSATLRVAKWRHVCQLLSRNGQGGEPLPYRVLDQLELVVDGQLTHDIVPMYFHCSDTRVDVFGNLFL